MARLPHRRVAIGSVIGLGALLLMYGLHLFELQAAAVPVVSPVYSIEASSGTHHASLLNLPVGQPGVIQAPIPVDVDGDLLPDVTVAVNLVYVSGLFANPPQPGKVLAPNVEINRLQTAVVLGQRSPPLKIAVKMTVKDIGGSSPDTTLTFGYDTGLGGSIPPFYKAVLGGLQTFFNPLEAVVDTTGNALGLHVGIDDYGLGEVVQPYAGPLTVVGSLAQGSQSTDMSFNYRPFPKSVRLTYGTDSAGQHITYAHSLLSPVDLTTDLKLTQGDSLTSVNARVDRLPRAVALDLGSASGGSGSVDYQAKQDGRLPDVAVNVSKTQPKLPPLNARVNIEALPPVMHGDWVVPQGTGTIKARFCAPAVFSKTDPCGGAMGAGIGAIETRIATFDGNPVALTPFVPSEQQYMNIQSAPGGAAGDEQLITGRVERIRRLEFNQATDGFSSNLQVGDGELPLQAHVGIAGGQFPGILDAKQTISPVPDSISVALHQAGTDPAQNPFKVTYDSSKDVDIDSRAEVRNRAVAATAPCGDVGTLCAQFNIRHLPSHIDVRVINGLTTPQGQPEARFELDDIPGSGSAQPDFFGDVTTGDLGGSIVSAPLVAHAELLGLSPFVRVRSVQGADKTLQRLEFHTCNLDYSQNPPACINGTENEIGAVKLNVHDWVTRPAGLPPPAAIAPLYTSVVARGVTTPNLVNFEAEAKVVHVRELQYLNPGGLFGLRTRVGGGGDLKSDIDIRNVSIPGLAAPGRISIGGSALITPLPDSMNVCFRRNGEPVTGTPTDAITAPCEAASPYGEGTLTKSPTAFAWRASSDFTVDTSFTATSDGGAPSDPNAAIRAFGAMRIENLPHDLTAYVQLPDQATNDPIRALTTTTSPAAGKHLNVSVKGELTFGGADCDNPRPGRPVLCANASVTDLPPNMSFILQKNPRLSTEFHACNYHFKDATPACVPGTAAQIGAITVGGRAFLGNPRGVPVFVPNRNQYAFAQADFIDANNLEARIGLRLVNIRNVAINQLTDGYKVLSDLGDGSPLQVKGYFDSRRATFDPADTGFKLDADGLINPLPPLISFEQHGPTAGVSTAPLSLTYDASAAVNIEAHGQLFLAGAFASNPSPACGTAETLCANVDVDNLPSHLALSMGQTDDPVIGTFPSAVQNRHLNVSLDATEPPAVAKPDFRVDAVVGLPSGTPLVGGGPLAARAEVVGFPPHVRARMDEVVKNPGSPQQTQEQSRLEVHACDYDFAGRVCNSPNPADKLDRFTVSARNFLVRPQGFAPPSAGLDLIQTPVYATVTGRDQLFEATANILDLSELLYVNKRDKGVNGFRVAAGGGRGLAAKIDLTGFQLGDQSIGDLAVQNAVIDLYGLVKILNLPSSIDVCVRKGANAVASPAVGDITTPCEDDKPFGSSVSINQTPLSFGYRASAPITQIQTLLDATIRGTVPSTNVAIDSRHIKGSVTIDNVPTAVTAHILQPKNDAMGHQVGPLRMQVDAPSAGPGLTVTFAGQLSNGDAVCQDPRPSATAICAAGRLANLPSHFALFYDPNLRFNNFHAETAGTAKMDWQNLELSSVKPRLDGSGNPIPGKADVLVATGQILGIGQNISVDGSLALPKGANQAPAIDLSANISIDQIDAVVKNFIAPDPTPQVVPVRPVNKHPLPADGVQTAYFFMRNEFFRAEAHIKKVKGVAYRMVQDATGAPLDTQLVKVDFGKDSTLRAYADIAPDSDTRIIADALLEQVPAGLSICLRGKNKHPNVAPAPGLGTYCDGVGVPAGESQVTDGNGVLQFLGSPLAPNLNGLDVDAFFRMSSGGGASILSGRLNISAIPYRVEGIIPIDANTDLDVSALDKNGSPQGIGQIRFNAANFDLTTGAGLTDSGYPAPDFVPQLNTSAPFPAVSTPNQHLGAVLDGSDYQFVGRLGSTDGSPASHLQRVRLLHRECSVPANDPADYPFFPHDGVSKYTCIAANLGQTSPSPNLMDLNAYIRPNLDAGSPIQPGQHIALTQAGITNVPVWFQATLAQTPTVGPEPNRSLLPRCGRAIGTDPATVGCMPPMLRFDQPAVSRLFGVAELGADADLQTLAGIAAPPGETIPAIGAAPGSSGAGWSDWPDVGGQGPGGIRANVAELGDKRFAARAGFRLPIPQSLTVDQFQTWSPPPPAANATPDADHFIDAKDFRFRVAIHDSSGNPVTIPLGQVAAMYTGSDGSKAILSKPCASMPKDRFLTGLGSCPEFTQGIDIPAEVGISLYLRNHKGHGKLYAQVDGRVSSPMTIGARLFGFGSIGRVEGVVRNVPSLGAGVGPDDATFRLRAMIIGEPEKPPSSGPPPAPGVPLIDSCPGGDAVALGAICVKTQVQIKSVFASFDFAPTGTPARRVDATINIANKGTKDGIELASYDSVTGGNPAPVGAFAQVAVDPLNVYVNSDLHALFANLANLVEKVFNDAGLPGFITKIAGFIIRAIGDVLNQLIHMNLTLESKLLAGVSFPANSHVTLQQNLIHLKMSNNGLATATLGPIDWYVHQLKFNANVGLHISTPWPFPDINIGLNLLELYFVPLTGGFDPYKFNFIPCNASLIFLGTPLGALFSDNTLDVNPGDTKNIVINPFQDPRLTSSGLFSGLWEVARSVVPPFFCFSGFDDIALGAPGDSVTDALVPGHPAFGSPLLADSVLLPGPHPATPPFVAVLPPPTPPPVPPTPPPSFVVTAASYPTGVPLPLCGPHDFTNFTVDSGAAVSVATVASASDTTGTGPDCPASAAGTLNISADHVTIHGTVDGNTRIDSSGALAPPGPAATGATGNSGGGHGVDGGAGSSGVGGHNPEDVRGQAGAGGAAGGKGGAGLTLSAHNAVASASVVVDGTIQMDGAVGQSDTSGACASDETVANPSPPPATTTVHHPASGAAAPGGGGAAGSLFISGPTVDVRGATIHANGGNGGDGKLGAGGGGTGGIYKVTSPIYLYNGSFGPGLAAGGAGAACSDQPQGNPGGTNAQILDNRPHSRLTGLNRSGTSINGTGVGVNFTTFGALQQPTGFTTYICGLQSIAVDPQPSFTLPTANSVGSPCGAGATNLGSVSTPAAAGTIKSDTATVNLNLDGTWALWSIAVRGPDVEPLPARGSPPAACQTGPSESCGSLVQVVDNTPPAVTITAPAPNALFNTQSVTLSFTDSDNISKPEQLARTCHVSVDDPPTAYTDFTPCTSGQKFTLSAGDGHKKLEVRVTDAAGNSTTQSVVVILQVTPPTASATISGPDQANWYRNPPAIKLSVPGGVSLGTPAYKFRIDNQPEADCASNPCAVPASAFANLPSGHHTFSFTAVDTQGNRYYKAQLPFTPMQLLPGGFNWDPRPPRTSLFTVPLGPNKTVFGNDWYTVPPFVVLSAIDEFGGSGLAGQSLSLNGGGTFSSYDVTNPLRLGPGVYPPGRICWSSVDVAGNVEPTTCNPNTIRIDAQAPIATLTVNPAAPDGANGYYVSVPAVTLAGYSDLAGVGAPTSGRFSYRVDNSDLTSCEDPCAINPALLGTGTHLVGWTAVDALGNRSAEATTTLNVDVDKPSTTAYVLPPGPNGTNGWYRKAPYVVLAGADQPFVADSDAPFPPVRDIDHLFNPGSGIAAMRYSLDGGATFQTYTGPFQVAQQNSRLCVSAIDVAGNAEPTSTCQPMSVDLQNPQVAINAAPAAPDGLAGWYTAPVGVTITASDPGAGASGFAPSVAPTGVLCSHLPLPVPPDAAPAGICVSIDSAPFVPYPPGFVITIPEGLHSVRTFAIDLSGRRSDIAVATYQVDQSTPVTSIRALPPAPAQGGWWRTLPRVVLRAVDGDQNSGTSKTEYSIDGPGGPFTTYTDPFTVPEGVHTVYYRSVDAAGRVENIGNLSVPVDVTPPVVTATSPVPALWLQLLDTFGNILGLSPSQAKLQWTVSDNLSPHVRITVLIYNVTGAVVRKLDGGTYNLTPGMELSGSTSWNGHDETITGWVPVGIYHYRVVATDDAGNTSQSGESQPIQIKASPLR